MVELGLAPRPAAERAALDPVAVTTCDSSAGSPNLRPVAFKPNSGPDPVHPLPGELTRQLAPFMERAGPHSGAYVYDATAQKSLFRWRASTARILASNTKLFTAATVLDRLRPLTEVRTKVLGSGSLRHGVWTGNLYLRGAGDPSFGARRSRIDINHLVRQLRKRGLRRLDGQVVGDASLFDSRTGGPDSGWRTSIFIGPVSALSFDRGKATNAEAAYQAKPALAAADVLRAALEKHGVEVSGLSATGTAPAGARRLATVASRPRRGARAAGGEVVGQLRRRGAAQGCCRASQRSPRFHDRGRP